MLTAPGCSDARYVNASLLTCVLPGVPASGVRGEWLNVTAAWQNSNRTQPFVGVSYAVFSSSSTAARAPSATSARFVTSSPPVASPAILSIRGCADVGSSTLQCNYTSTLTILGTAFGSRAGTVFIHDQYTAPAVYSWNATRITCSVPTAQYEPGKLLTVRVQTADSSRSPAFSGMSYAAITPIITELRSGSQRGSTIRVSPGDMITVIGSSFPTSNGNLMVVLNRTASSSGQYLGSADIRSTTEAVAQLPPYINANVQRNVPLPLTIITYYISSAPFTPGVVIVPSTSSSSSSSTGVAMPKPEITSISGCEDDGNRTRNCLMMHSIPLTITGSFPGTEPDRAYIGNNADSAPCSVTHYTTSYVRCTTPAVSFQVNSVYQVWLVWRNGVNATMYGIWFTDRLAPPTVDYVQGAGCIWNDTAAVDCQRGNTAWLTIAGQHFPLYLDPEITIGGSNCTQRNNNQRVRDRLTCRVTNTSLPANTLLPLQVAFAGRRSVHTIARV